MALNNDSAERARRAAEQMRMAAEQARTAAGTLALAEQERERAEQQRCQAEFGRDTISTNTPFRRLRWRLRLLVRTTERCSSCIS
jgi:hypothetical protein